MATQPKPHLTLEELTGLRQRRAARLIIEGKERPYHTTATSCDCRDWIGRCRRLGIRCKHQEELAISQDLQARTAQQQASPAKALNARAVASGRCSCPVFVLRGNCQHVPEDEGL